MAYIGPHPCLYAVQVLASQDIHEMDDDEVTKIVEGTGTVRGWMPFTVGETPWSYDVSIDIPEELQAGKQMQREAKRLVTQHKNSFPSRP